MSKTSGEENRASPTIGLYFFHLDKAAGGAERSVCSLANALVEKGFRVHLISWDKRIGAQTFYPLRKEIKWHRLGFRRGLGDKVRRCVALARLMRRNNIRVIVGFVMSGDKTVYFAARLAGARVIVAERNSPAMYHIRYSAFQRYTAFVMLHLADRITVQFPRFVYGYPASLRKKIVVISNPVPQAHDYAKPGIPGKNGRFTLLTVSRLDGVQKRVDGLLRAFARIADDVPEWDLKIIGDGPERGELVRLTHSLGISERVTFQRTFLDISRAYVDAHLFVMPSLWEGFPNALAEALSHGLPGVGFEKAAGISDLIENGSTGWLAKGLDDHIALAETLREAMTSPEERIRRGAIAINAMAAYDPEIQYDHWANLLRISGGVEDG